MTWKVKKDYKGKIVPNCYYPLDDLTQNQIKKLGEGIRNAYFIQEKPKQSDTITKKSKRSTYN